MNYVSDKMASKLSEIERGSSSSPDPATSGMYSSRLIVGAIDFGTTYSGFAFSFKNEPTKVNNNVYH